jgi:hypothetical protein
MIRLTSSLSLIIYSCTAVQLYCIFEIDELIQKSSYFFDDNRFGLQAAGPEEGGDGSARAKPNRSCHQATVRDEYDARYARKSVRFGLPGAPGLGGCGRSPCCWMKRQVDTRGVLAWRTSRTRAPVKPVPTNKEAAQQIAEQFMLRKDEFVVRGERDRPRLQASAAGSLLRATIKAGPTVMQEGHEGTGRRASSRRTNLQ